MSPHRGRSWTLYVLALIVIAAGVVFVAVQTARADTETSCGVTHNEFENMQRGLTVNQVWNRFDVYGIYLDDTPNYFRRGYKTCWAPGERRVIVEFSYTTNDPESIDWYVRDV